MAQTTDEAEPTPDTALATALGLATNPDERIDSTRLGPLKIERRDGPYYDIMHLDGQLAIQTDVINVEGFASAGALAGYLWWMLGEIEASEGDSLAVTPSNQVAFWGDGE